MKILIIGVAVVLLLVVALSVYVRMAPVTPRAVQGQYQADTDLAVHAHLVFGAADLGVNKARVLAWLDQLGPL